MLFIYLYRVQIVQKTLRMGSLVKHTNVQIQSASEMATAAVPTAVVWPHLTRQKLQNNMATVEIWIFFVVCMRVFVCM